jgi:hypothetical protein
LGWVTYGSSRLILVVLGNLTVPPGKYTCFAWARGTFFSSCAVVSVFWFWREIGFGCTYYYVLRVPYSFGVVLVFLVLAGNSFLCFVRTKCTIQLYGCVIFFVVAGKIILYEFSS